MGRRPRSRASRSERRVLRERAESALKHGLPVAMPPAARTRVPDVPGLRSSSVPPSGSGPSALSRRMPLAVKLLGIGLLLLGVIYGLTLFRDHPSEADAAPSAAETDTPRAAPLQAPSAPRPTEAAPIMHKTAIVTANASPTGAAPPSAPLPVAPAPP